MSASRLSVDDARQLLALAQLELEAEREGMADGDPVAWIEQRLGDRLWSKQAEIARSVRDHRLTAVHSCHGIGKSFIAARLACWWIAGHPAGSAFVVTTAPTFEQVRAILWREIGRAHAKGHLPGRVNQTEWWIGSELVAFGRKPADSDEASFQGIHARAVLVVIDEAAGVPQALWHAATSLTSSEDSRVLALGNPDDPGSYFASVCKPGAGWNVIGVDAFESPNFTDEPVPDELRPLLVSPTWVEERAAEWGTESPLYVAKVRGQFPDSTSDGVIPLSWVQRCRRDPADPAVEAAWASLTPVELGVDVGAGGDRTVIYARRGPRASLAWRGTTPDPGLVVGRVMEAIREHAPTRVKVDAIGIGWGIAGRLEELREEGGHDAEIVAVNVGDAARDPTRFPRVRDELWWEVGRELSRTSGWDLRAVDDTTVGQLIAPHYAPDSSGRIKVEPKADTRARLGRSPDDADALLLAFYDPGTLTDPAFVYGLWVCAGCGRGFHWTADRPCPYCRRPAPHDDPFADGPGRPLRESGSPDRPRGGGAAD
jgi:hypothetical protein